MIDYRGINIGTVVVGVERRGRVSRALPRWWSHSLPLCVTWTQTGRPQQQTQNLPKIRGCKRVLETRRNRKNTVKRTYVSKQGTPTRWDPGTERDAGGTNYDLVQLSAQVQHHDQRMSDFERQLKDTTAGRSTGSGAASSAASWEPHLELVRGSGTMHPPRNQRTALLAFLTTLRET